MQDSELFLESVPVVKSFPLHKSNTLAEKFITSREVSHSCKAKRRQATLEEFDFPYLEGDQYVSETCPIRYKRVAWCGIQD